MTANVPVDEEGMMGAIIRIMQLIQAFVWGRPARVLERLLKHFYGLINR